MNQVLEFLSNNQQFITDICQTICILILALRIRELQENNLQLSKRIIRLLRIIADQSMIQLAFDKKFDEHDEKIDNIEKTLDVMQYKNRTITTITY